MAEGGSRDGSITPPLITQQESEFLRLYLRPPPPVQIDAEARTRLHRQIVIEGKHANQKEAFIHAQNWFDCAYTLSSAPSDMLSAANMRFKQGQVHLAAELYKFILQLDQITEKEASMAERKLEEAYAAIEEKEAHHEVHHDEEVYQQLQALVAPYDTSKMLDEDRLNLHTALVQFGLEANRAGDFLRSEQWFASAYALDAKPADLLSAANMRLKLGQHTLAKAMYEYAIQLPALMGKERQMAERKLREVTPLMMQEMQPQRSPHCPATPYSPTNPVQQQL